MAIERRIVIAETPDVAQGRKLPAYVPEGMPVAEIEKRMKRWRFFKIMFWTIYIGVIGDIVTTAMGFHVNGSSYEQNPLGGALIGHLGWIGLFGFMTAVSALCYVSCRAVYWRMRLGWTRLIDVLLTLVATVRWLTIVATVSYLLGSR